MTIVYRGYRIMKGSEQFPFHVYQGNGVDVIYCARSEDEAYAFIDKSKRELAQAAKDKKS